MFRTLALAGLISLLVAGHAVACRKPIAQPAKIMARDFVTVATARVLSARPAPAGRPNREFSAHLEILRTVQGHAQSGRLTFSHRETTECPRVLPLPRAGEVWVVYLEWEAGQGGPVTYAWPLTWAQRLDPRFGGLPRAASPLD